MNIEYLSSDNIMNFGILLFFLVFIMLVTIFYTTIRSTFIKKKYKKHEPNISIIIPSYNEEDNIEECLNAVLKSNYDKKKLQIICVDDGSTDNTFQVISKYAKKHKQIQLIKGKHEGKSKALNLGVKKAKHEFVMTLDADTIIDKNFIKEIIAPFADKEVGATNGIAHVKNPGTIIEHFQSIEYYLNNLIRQSFSTVFDNGIWFFGAAACFRKEVLSKSGFFNDKVLTEDMDISLKIFEHGYQVLTVKDAAYYTRGCKSIKELFIQRMRWFYGGLQCVYNHKKLLKRKAFSIKYLFFNQVFWSVFSVLVIPLIIYQVNFWYPEGFTPAIAYLFRWFSLAGPFYVLYKIPEWGLSLVNIFGVMAGIITAVLIFEAIKRFKGKIDLKKLVVIFFYFPYTLLLNAILTSAIVRYAFSKKKHFIK